MQVKQPFHVMAKPIGPKCNLRCDYCFYLDKTLLFDPLTDFRMSDEVLATFVKQYIHSQPGPEVAFSWQGGEPTLLGIDFFRRVTSLQREYLPKGWSCSNAIQTNGTLLSKEWAHFLAEERFLVGLSVDGPQSLHDLYRKTADASSTWSKVKEAAGLLKQAGTDFNILCVVNKSNGERPHEVYQAFKALGADFIQFIPLVELAEEGQISHKSVSGPVYGRFLIQVFNMWLTEDMGKVYVQLFEEALRAWMDMPSTLCVFSQYCGRQLIVEHNGDVYSCDHYVRPANKLGNLLTRPLIEMVNSTFQQEFGRQKADLPQTCQNCEVLFACRGGCPKNRQDKLNTLCLGYKQFFTYVKPFMQQMAACLKQGKQVSAINQELTTLLEQLWNVSRNDPCPCGSGQKYKKCCLGLA